MSEKQGGKKPKAGKKGSGNKQTRQRRESKEHSEKRKSGSISSKKSETSKSEEKVQVTDETPVLPTESLSDKVDGDAQQSIKEEEVVKEVDSEIIDGSINSIPELETNREELPSMDHDQLDSNIEAHVGTDNDKKSNVKEDQEIDEEVKLSIENLDETEYISEEMTTQMTTTNTQLTTSTSNELLILDVEVDQPSTPVGQFIKSKIAKYGTPIDLKKFLLPYEKHLNAKMVIYFGEGQIFLGLAILISAFVSYAIWSILGVSLVLGLVGLTLLTTSYASEELHITNYRILIRRMNWVDRMFRIPKDSQYIIDEIVAFDIQRAPVNRALLITGLFPLLLLFSAPIRSSNAILFVILLISIIVIVVSQRLGKRTISFLMSGGHQVHLGRYKGVPNDIIESFTDIVMEKNVYESDNY